MDGIVRRMGVRTHLARREAPNRSAAEAAC